MQAVTSGQGPGEGFLGSLIRSATSTDAQIFTEAAPPFKICHANNAWTQLCGFTVAEALGKTCKILQGPETSAESLRELHAGLAARPGGWGESPHSWRYRRLEPGGARNTVLVQGA